MEKYAHIICIWYEFLVQTLQLFFNIVFRNYGHLMRNPLLWYSTKILYTEWESLQINFPLYQNELNFSFYKIRAVKLLASMFFSWFPYSPWNTFMFRSVWVIHQYRIRGLPLERREPFLRYIASTEEEPAMIHGRVTGGVVWGCLKKEKNETEM